MGAECVETSSGSPTMANHSETERTSEPSFHPKLRVTARQIDRQFMAASTSWLHPLTVRLRFHLASSRCMVDQPLADVIQRKVLLQFAARCNRNAAGLFRNHKRKRVRFLRDPNGGAMPRAEPPLHQGIRGQREKARGCGNA